MNFVKKVIIYRFFGCAQDDTIFHFSENPKFGLTQAIPLAGCCSRNKSFSRKATPSVSMTFSEFATATFFEEQNIFLDNPEIRVLKFVIPNWILDPFYGDKSDRAVE